MANIGSFKKSGQEFQGEIVTLSLQTKGVRIVPEANRSNDKAPSHRVFVGRVEIGAAWSKQSNEGRDYLSLDDPSFTTPIFANLFDDPDGESYTLIWSCGRKSTADLAVPSTEPRPADGGITSAMRAKAVAPTTMAPAAAKACCHPPAGMPMPASAKHS